MPVFRLPKAVSFWSSWAVANVSISRNGFCLPTIARWETEVWGSWTVASYPLSYFHRLNFDSTQSDIFHRVLPVSLIYGWFSGRRSAHFRLKKEIFSFDKDKWWKVIRVYSGFNCKYVSVGMFGGRFRKFVTDYRYDGMEYIF